MVSDAAAAILNVANFHYFHCLATQSCGSLTVYWSLSLEEQFYWIFPLLLLVLPRRVLVVVLIAIAAVQIVLPRPNSFITVQPSLLWLVRTDAICLGILLALFESQGKTTAPPSFVSTPRRARLVSFALLIVLAIAAAPAFHFPQATGVLALASCGLVWLARFDRGLILPKTRFDSVLLWIGSRSYSLYLIHPVSGRLAAEIRDRSALLVPRLSAPMGVLIGVSLTIGLTLGFAELNFRFLETPLRKIGTRITRGQALGRTQTAGAPAAPSTI
jgi:peptidoglycan/LPS O-acetylase OafA/YrhL